MTTILLIDDETDERDSVAKVLRREGYEVFAAEDAESGLALLDEQRIDLVITDIIMPGIDGVQAIKRIRDSHPDMKIVAISGGGNFGHASYQPQAITTTAFLQAATEAGADGILTKPFLRDDILESVQRMIHAQ
jgi:CheY-like chemotaxis protein